MTDRLDLRRRLHAVAYRQAGYFTAAQAVDLGYSYQAQKYHADRGNWARVDRGLFRLTGWPAAADDPYARWTVWSGGVAVVSHASATGVHDLGDLDPGEVHLILTGSRGRAGVVVHDAVLVPGDVEDRGSFRVTSVTRTILDLAASDVTQEQLDTIIGDAEAQGRLSRGALRRRMDDFGPSAALRLERALASAAA